MSPCITPECNFICMEFHLLDFVRAGEHLRAFAFPCHPGTHCRDTDPSKEGCFSSTGWAPVRCWAKSCCKGGSKGGHIPSPLKMANALNYLMSIPLQGSGVCFLQMKSVQERCDVSETLLDVFQLEFHSQLYPQSRARQS